MIGRPASRLPLAVLVAVLATGAVAITAPGSARGQGRAAATAAPANQIEDAEHYFRLAVPDDWQPVTASPGGEEILLAYRQPDGPGLLAVTRAAYPNRRAWRRDQTFFDQVEAGFVAAGMHRDRRKIRRLGRVPAMDLELSDPHGRVAVRILFFRTFSLILAIRTDRHRRSRRAARTVLAGFEPYFAK